MTFLRSAKPKITPVKLRMVKSGGNQAGVGLSYNMVTSMVADSLTDPELIVANGIIIPWDWPAFYAEVYGQVSWTGGISPKVGCMIRHNQSELAKGSIQTNSSNNAWASKFITVYPGDEFDLFWQGEGNFFTRPSCRPGELTYLSITPQ